MESSHIRLSQCIKCVRGGRNDARDELDESNRHAEVSENTRNHCTDSQMGGSWGGGGRKGVI